MSGRITYDHWPQGEPPPLEISTGEPTPFATFIKRRNPVFKPHSSLSHAKGALSNIYMTRRVNGVAMKAFIDDAALYEWDGVNNRWLLRVHVESGHTKDEYILWSDPEAFKTGLTHIIDEAPHLEDA